MMRISLVAAFALAGLALNVDAGQRASRAKPAHDPNAVVFYRCEDARGNISYQNDVPCGKGLKQSRQVMQRPQDPLPAPLPMSQPAAMPAVATPSPNVAPVAYDTPAPVVASRLPPPPLFRCYTMQRKSYLSDNGAPKPRCIPLTATGVVPGDANAPQMCDMQQDTCERIPDQDLCSAWGQYDREAQSLVAMGHPDYIEDATRLAARTSKVMQDSTCATQNP